MRITTGAAISLAVMVMAGCSTGVTATAPAVTTGNAHTRSVEIVQTVMPGVTVAQAEEAMQTTCDMIDGRPTTEGILGIRDNLVAKGFGSKIEVTAIISASIAGTCPQHLDAIKGI